MENKTSNQDIIVSLIDLSESNDYDLTLNKIIKNLQQKNKQIIKRKYTQLPFKLTIISITFVFSIILLIIYMPSILSILG
jgi:disulfide oxidoreductase YuzD